MNDESQIPETESQLDFMIKCNILFSMLKILVSITLQLGPSPRPTLVSEVFGSSTVRHCHWSVKSKPLTRPILLLLL